MRRGEPGPAAGPVGSVTGAVTGSLAGPIALLRVLARRRRLLAAGFAAAAVATALPLLAPTPAAGRTVLAAARDLPAGSALTAGDLVPLSLPDAAVPAGALAGDTDVTGRVVAGAVRRGEPITDVRLLGPGLLALSDSADLVAVPVRLADPASAGLLRAGDRVDVLAAGTAPEGPLSAAVVASEVTVLAVPQQVPELDGALVVLATTSPTAARLAAAAVSSRLSVVVLPPT